MFTNIKADVTVSLNHKDVMSLINEGQIETNGVSIELSEPEASELLSRIEQDS